ncbi:MAG: diguanylate cyclase [Acholeplasmatales bacterium]|nr:diguanylate cyclase [Acholeplasmatales bacterium]
MLSLNELLNLDMTESSIKKLDMYLETESKTSYDYILVAHYKAIILNKLGKVNEALKILYDIVNDFDKLDSKSVIKICDGIIDICFGCKRYDQVGKFIEIKKEYLPISEESIYLHDLIRLALTVKQYDKAKNILIEYLKDDITKEELVYAKLELSKIYFFERDFDSYLETIPQVEEYYLDNVKLDDLLIVRYNKLYIIYQKENYLECINKGNELLKESNNNSRYALKIATLLIKSYLKVGGIKKATILESDFEELAQAQYLDESIDFCYACLDLYNIMGSAPSISSYHNKLKKLLDLKDLDNISKSDYKDDKPQFEPEIFKPKKKEKEIKPEDVIIPIVKTPEATKNYNISPLEGEAFDFSHSRREKLNPKYVEPVVIKQEVIKKVDNKLSIGVSEDFKRLEKLFNNISKLNLDTKFREVYRLICIEICKLTQVEEIYLMYLKRKMYGLHFKKERAYDKNLNEADLKNTLNYECYIRGTELFLDQSDRSYNKDIVNNDLYGDDIYGFSMPLNNNIDSIGSITFIGHTPFIIQPNTYELLKLITSIINTRLLMWLNQDSLEYENKKKFFIIDNMSQGIKECQDGYVHLNETAQAILGIMEDISLDDYIYHIDLDYRVRYKRIYNDIYENELLDETMEYPFDNGIEKLFIKETFKSIIIDGKFWIISLIDDITSSKKEKNELKELAYKNPISKMETELKLTIDLNNEIKKLNMALAIIEIDDFKLYSDLYGLEFMNQLIYTVGQKINDYLSNHFKWSAYHLDRDRYAIIFRDLSDRRLVDKYLNEIFNYVSDEIYKLNKRVKLKFNCGCFRVNKSTINKTYQDVISYALDALNDAIDMESNSHSIAHYNNELSKLRFYNNNLITRISEAIDQNRLAINYQQVVDLIQREVYAYFVMPSLDEMELPFSKIEEVAIRKNKIIEIDKYVIFRAIMELKMLYTTKKGFFNVYVYVHDETLKELYSFIKKALEKYKINPKFFGIIINQCNNNVNDIKSLKINIMSKNIVDIFNDNVDCILYDYKSGGSKSIESFNNLAKEFNKDFIIDNIDTEEELKYCLENKYQLVFGNRYKALKRMSEIIEDL